MHIQFERLTDSQWEVIKEYLPTQRKRKLDLREVFNAILWITRTGAQWRNLDSSFPSWTAVYYYFYKWTGSGVIAKVNRALNELERIELERNKTPSLGIVDSQSVKLATKLSTFKRKSSFRTWAYRIAFNQFLQTKRRPMEDRWESLEHFADELNSIPSPELSPEEEKEEILRTKTARTRCMSGMLMCLTREQRLLYLIGEVFKIDHQIGAEVFNISKDNYRKKLSRTRKEFHAFMNQQCGLVNLANPCRCSKKAKAMEAAGKMQTNAKVI
jgi:transposase